MWGLTPFVWKRHCVWGNHRPRSIRMVLLCPRHGCNTRSTHFTNRCVNSIPMSILFIEHVPLVVSQRSNMFLSDKEQRHMQLHNTNVTHATTECAHPERRAAPWHGISWLQQHRSVTAHLAGARNPARGAMRRCTMPGAAEMSLVMFIAPRHEGGGGAAQPDGTGDDGGASCL